MQRKGGESKFNIILECLKLYYNEMSHRKFWGNIVENQKKKKRKKWAVGLDCHFRLKETQTQTTAQLPGFVWNGWWLGVCVMSEDLKFSEFVGVNEIYLTHLAKKWVVFININ